MLSNNNNLKRQLFLKGKNELKRHADGEDNHWPCKHSSSFALFIPLVFVSFYFCSLHLPLPFRLCAVCAHVCVCSLVNYRP